MYRTTLLLLFIFQCFFITAQDTRATYEADFQKQKTAIDAATGATFSEVISSPGFEFATPFVGIFPMDVALTQLNNRFKKDSFAMGDTFHISKVTWPLMNPAVGVPGSELIYATGYKVKAKDYLVDPEGYAATIAKLKKSKPIIKPIMPLWGALFCSPLDDDSEDFKAEKYFLNTDDSWSLHFKFSKEKTKTRLTFGLRYSMNKDGDSLEGYGCAVPGKTYLQLHFADGTTFKKLHEGEENCYDLTAELSEEDKLLLKKRVVKVELSLSKRKFEQDITDPMNQDIIGLKLDCVN